MKNAETAIFEPLSASPPTWRGAAKPLLTVWRMPSFDPYVSWTAFETGQIWIRRVVAEQNRIPQPPNQIDTYVADVLGDRNVLSDLLDSLVALAGAPPAIQSGIIIDGMIVGIRSADADIRWQGGQEPHLDAFWSKARNALDAAMPATTIPLTARHPMG